MNPPGMTDLLRSTRDGLRNAAATYGDEEDWRAFGSRVLTQLESAHTQAVVIGRNHAGDHAAVEQDDRTFAQMVIYGEDGKTGEMGFLEGFVQDLHDGRYVDDDGTLDVAAIEQRAELYASRIVGTANEAFALASDLEAMFTWVLGIEADHCGDCPDLADGSPYGAEELPAHPGSNDTECLFRCKCTLERDDGTQGFETEE